MPRDTYSDAAETQKKIDAACKRGDWKAAEELTAGYHARRAAAAVAGTPLCERIGK
jgi:hypothetical protein